MTTNEKEIVKNTSVQKRKRSSINILLWILGILGIFDTFLVYILSGSANLGTIAPGVIGAVMIWIAVMRRQGKSIGFRNKILNRLFYMGVITFLLSFVIIQSIIIIGSREQSDHPVDYVVILGTGLIGDRITYTLKYRLDAGLQYLVDNPESRVVVSGGQGPNELISEAQAMESYLKSKGVAPERIIAEDQSTSTIENLMFSREILTAIDPDLPLKPEIMVVTSDFHLFRSKMIARRCGFIAYGIPARTSFEVIINCYIREYFALVKSFLFDKVPFKT